MTARRAAPRAKPVVKPPAPGRILLMTGDGKGKTTAALGLVLRAAGRGLNCAMFSFIKAPGLPYGEQLLARKLPRIRIQSLGRGFTWRSSDLRRDCAAARAGWTKVRAALQDARIDLVVLDEITFPVGFGWLSAAEVVAAIKRRPAGQHVVMTGRRAPRALVALADTVTEMRVVKHAFRKGIPATKGIEL